MHHLFWLRGMAGLLAALGFAAALAGSRPARAADPPLFDFETGTQEWACPQQGASVGITQLAENVKVGQAALEWSYDPAPDSAVLLRRMPEIKAGASSLDFWIKCSADATLQLWLGESGGGRWHLCIRTDRDRWQHYRVNLSDLTSSWTQDSNKSLDLDQVNAMALYESSRFAADPAALQPRKVWLDGVSFTNENTPQRRSTQTVGGKQELLFDDFEGEALGWEARTSTAVSLKKVDGRSVLRIGYDQGKGSTRPLGLTDHIDGRYSQMKALKLVARAPAAARLLLQFMEYNGSFDGPIYRASVEIPAGKEWRTLTVPVSDFKLLNANTDPNNKLDLDAVWLIFIQDGSEAEKAAPAELEIDSLAALLTE
jgi:hypothetical protein